MCIDKNKKQFAPKIPLRRKPGGLTPAAPTPSVLSESSGPPTASTSTVPLTPTASVITTERHASPYEPPSPKLLTSHAAEIKDGSLERGIASEISPRQMGILAPTTTVEQHPMKSNDDKTTDSMATPALSIHPPHQSFDTVLQVQSPPTTRLTTQTIAYTPTVHEIPGVDPSEANPRPASSPMMITAPRVHAHTTSPLTQTNEEGDVCQLELLKVRRKNAYDSSTQGIDTDVEMDELEGLIVENNECVDDGARDIVAKVNGLRYRGEHEENEEVEKENEETSNTDIQESQAPTGDNHAVNIATTSNAKTKIPAKPRVPRKRKISTVSTDATDPIEAGPSSTLPKKLRAPRKPRKPTIATTRAETPESAATAIGADPTGNTATPIKSRGRTREVTPPNSEELQILPGVVKMADLCRDIKIGKKSKRFTELEKLDWTEVVRKQRATKAQIQAARAAGVEIPPPESAEERIERLAAEIAAVRPPIPQQRHAMQVRVVNGQIVLDEETLQIDRRELAQEDGPREIVEENSLTRRVNAGTWSKREKPERWDMESTEKFYEGLGMFGTDFELISGLFPDRSRRQIKNKFNAEERRNPVRVTNALRKRVVVGML